MTPTPEEPPAPTGEIPQPSPEQPSPEAAGKTGEEPLGEPSGDLAEEPWDGTEDGASEEPPSRRPAPSDRPLVRAGLRGFLDLGRTDVILVVALTLLAFVLRFASPILPNFLGGNATPQPAIQVLGVGHAFNSDPSACQAVAIGNSTIKACGQIFDEVYFPTDAADDLHSPAISYFDPEPPLVKLLMTPSIAWIGFNTWGWRITQVVTGSLFVGLLYLIALRLRRDRFFAVCAALLVCFDGLAFVESRTGLIDMPAIFFVAIVYYLFLLHWQARTRRQWRITLYLTALALGLAFAAKLTALAPLVVMAALIGFRLLAPYAAALVPALRRLAGPRRAETVLWREAAGRRALLHYGAGALLVGVVFCAAYSRYETISHDDVYRFVACNPAVPGLTTDALHPVDFLPVPVTVIDGITLPNPAQAIANIEDINSASLQYHEHECHGHPYASRWYTWPIMEHPVLFYAQSDHLLDAPTVAGTAVITDMGNPAVWWLGILALLFCVWRMMAGPTRLRVGLGALMVASLTTMIITFHNAEPAINAITGTQPGPIHPPGILFDLGFLGMAVFCASGVVFAVVSRRFVPSFIVLGYIASWMMWVPGNEQRVLFFYHALGMLIFTALALAYALTAIRGVRFQWRGRWWSLAPLAYAGIAVVVAAFLFFYPVWTAIPQTAADHLMRVWVSTW
ncbi:MAG: phospholipid carrier-dependent glycosyltransferase [Candidatus Dormibacteria bacterium]|jgi:hypothetical protein